MEHGYLPNTIQIDPRGVNAGSSITNAISEEMLMKMSVDGEKMYLMQGEGFVQRGFPDDVLPRYDDTNDDDPLPERYALFIMQVHDDSNLIHYGEGWTNEAAIMYVQQQVSRGMQLVVKEHPSDYGRIEYQKPAGVDWRRTTSTADLIAGAESVWTINSSVAVEAMRQKKKVHVLGRAAFADIANRYSGVNQEVVDRYLYWLRWHYLIKTNPFALNDEGNVQAAQRILDIAAGKTPWMDCFV